MERRASRPGEPRAHETGADTSGATPEGSAADDLGVLDDLLAMVRVYLRDHHRPGVPVVEYRDPAALRELLDLRSDGPGLPTRELLPIVEAYLRYSVRTAHPQFHNQLFSGFDLSGFLGEVVSSLTNTTMCTYEAAPVATLLERELVERMGRLVGYEETDGLFCSGGSNANLLGLLCARQRAFPGVERVGLPAGVRPTLFVSDQAHYSLAKAANVLGLGLEALVAVATDADGCMLPGRLDEAVEQARRRGRTPFCVAATAGTTVLGAFDPLQELADVASRHGLWLHVDGSLGGPVLLSERHRRLLDGAQLSDSFSWDAHKLMGATLTCSAFLTRHGAYLREACCASDHATEYILHEGPDAQLDLGRSSLQCGRRVDALKLWLMWKRHGERGLATRIEHLFDLARYAADKVRADPGLELAAPVQSVNVCFRHLGDAAGDLDAFNLRLRERLRTSGAAFVNYAPIGGRHALRLAFSNPNVTTDDVDRFFEHVARAAAELPAPDGVPAPDAVPS